MKKGSGRLLLIIAVLIFSIGFTFLKNVDWKTSINQMRIVRQPGTDMIRKGLDLKGGVYAVLEAKPTQDVTEINEDAMRRLMEVLQRRVDGLGVAEATVQRLGEKRVVIEVPGYEKPEDILKLIGKTALLEFKLVNRDGSLGKTEFTGSLLEKADVRTNAGEVKVSFQLNEEGRKKFADITKRNVKRKLAITLDGEVQVEPVIQVPILEGSGEITGGYTIEEATKLANLLNAGALPVEVEILETKTVGATLGEESITKSMNAAYLAVGLIMIFMVFVYRMSGLVANLALLCFGIITFGMLNFFDATLTLPGIAGFILSVGMAVDANVIIFERIKEELRAGGTTFKAIDLGFSKAMSAIVDSNVTTLLVIGILFFLGTGPVKGFAVTLTIGILSSMFTAIVITKLLLKGCLKLFKVKDRKWFFTV